MTNYKLAAAGLAAAVSTLLAGTIAVAAQPAPLAFCQTWNPAKAGPQLTHCVTWKHEGAARLRAANCDPSMKDGAAMRARCLAMLGDQGDASHAAAAG